MDDNALEVIRQAERIVWAAAAGWYDWVLEFLSPVDLPILYRRR